MQQATIYGINHSFVVATWLTVAALVLAFFIRKASPREDAVDEPVMVVEEMQAPAAAEFAENQDRSDRQSADSEFRDAIRGFLKPPQPAKDNEHFNDNEYRKALLAVEGQPEG